MVIVSLKITPNASQNEVVGWKEGILYLRIRGVPEKGQVNEELVKFLAKKLGIAKSKIAIVSGFSSRFKRIQIEGFQTIKELPFHSLGF